MGRYTKEELEKKDLLDLIRSDTRLKYRQAMRWELNDTEDAALKEQEARRANDLPAGVDLSQRAWSDGQPALGDGDE